MKIIQLAAIFLLLLMSIPLFARKPAVEPVMGISIEERNHIYTPPNKWFDFKRTPQNIKIENKNDGRTPIKKDQLRNVTTKDQSDTTRLPVYIAMLIILLPFALIGGVVTPLKKEKSQQYDKLRLVDEDHDSQDNSSDDDIKKAS